MMKILIAEDDRTTRLLLCRSLGNWGHETVAASDGEEAWRLLNEQRLRMLISDWEMPALDGISLCRRIRERGGDYVYVLLLTAHRDPADTVRGLEAGADDFITKPFHAAELRARIGVGERILQLQDELAAKNRELELANAALARIAATDPLTGLGNRRGFEETIVYLHGRALDAGEPYGVLMLDIDHFKRFNDQYGHMLGDRVLAEVASALRRAIGDRGQLFRYGGEEIAALVPEPQGGVAALAQLGEALRSSVLGVEIRVGRETPRISASVGVTLCDGAERLPWQQIVVQADQALYASKRGGRDRVTAWPSDAVVGSTVASSY